MTQEQEEAFNETSKQIAVITGLMRSVKRLKNDVLSAELHNSLRIELQAKQEFLREITTGIYGKYNA